MTAIKLDKQRSVSALPDEHHHTRFACARMASMLAFLGVLLFILAGFTHDFIPSASMMPGLRPGDHIVAMRAWLAYPGGRMPARGDIIVFRMPHGKHSSLDNGPDSGVVRAAEISSSAQAGANGGSDIIIKRVIGLPGDVVQIKDNDVYINGKKLNEPYPLVRLQDDDGYDFPYAVYEPLRVPPGQLFVLGDNRNNSDDGRFWGTLPRANVVARYVTTLYHESKWDDGDQSELLHRVH